MRREMALSTIRTVTLWERNATISKSGKTVTESRFYHEHKQERSGDVSHDGILRTPTTFYL